MTDESYPLRANKQTAQGILEAARRVLRRGTSIPYPEQPRRTPGVHFDGKLTSDLSTGSLEAPSTATFEFWDPNPASTDDPPPFIATGVTQTLVNRSSNLEGTSGTAVVVARWRSEWRIVWIDC